MKLVYVAGPYSGPDYLSIDTHIAAARESCANLATSRIGFISPHMNSAHFEVITPEVPYDFWIEMTLEIMRRCDAVYVLPGWAESKGTIGELDEASRLGLPIFHCGDELELALWVTESEGA
jgi:hypothetical protein